ncbi:MAG: nucleotidyltransferase domain-containing protein [Candidatus Nanohaloarchaea archaeon]|nr:nucleotidyltransferase domain-containing protein [Candidatus Nanohaloarchaea archaeon]
MAEEVDGSMDERGMEGDRLSSLLFNRKRYNILAYLLTHGDKEEFITISDIADSVDSTRQHITNFVNSLRDLGLVEKRKKGNMYLIEVNRSSPYFGPLKDLLSVDARPLKEVAEDVAEEIMEEHGEKIVSIYLFGSVARGAPRIDSDIDLLVVYQEDEWEDEERRRIEDDVIKKGNEFKVRIQMLWYSLEEWERGLRRGTAINRRIIEEGICLEGDELEA